ncbi:unnamed protein product [Rotaria sordida]|uniref:Uncharacterized protein n=1 Tax=Rotaria sordida TaxID=392033 RepID=A0A819RYV5_9BILA|nr:unnamed protein product [Rotaria sordida]
MDENILRSRQKVASKSDEKTSDQEKEKMLIKNRKQTGENYDFGDIEKSTLGKLIISLLSFQLEDPLLRLLILSCGTCAVMIHLCTSLNL